MRQDHHYQCFAEILNYPSAGGHETVAAALAKISESYPEERETLSPLLNFVLQSPEGALQELYTRTFEIQPICYLDIGYVLFGEDYKRGQFLVHMNREHEKAENSCGTELSDYLPNVLRLLAKIEDSDFAADLTQVFLLPALEKMLPGFGEKGNVYGGALQALSRVLKRDFPATVESEIWQGALS